MVRGKAAIPPPTAVFRHMNSPWSGFCTSLISQKLILAAAGILRIGCPLQRGTPPVANQVTVPVSDDETYIRRENTQRAMATAGYDMVCGTAMLAQLDGHVPQKLLLPTA